MCLYPKLVSNPKYRKNKKNGGNIPKVKDPRVLMVPIGCGKCIECTKKRAREWQARLHQELKTNRNALFVTLTFSNESLRELYRLKPELEGYDLENETAVKAMRRFLERWRKKYGKSVRHWFVTELGSGDTERLHLHGILWTDKGLEEIKDRWQYGHVWIGQYCNERTINYMVKYVHKVDEVHKEYKSRILCSQGIGRSYVESTAKRRNSYREAETNTTYKTSQGHKIGLPIYYRNYLYTEEEREKLWLYTLDKEERWVLGQKISVANGEEEYYATLKHAREKNKRLGFGDDSINWERRRYERNKRKLLDLDRDWETLIF